MHVCVLCDAKVCSLLTGEQGFMAAVLGCPLSDVVKRCVCVRLHFVPKHTNHMMQDAFTTCECYVIVKCRPRGVYRI